MENVSFRAPEKKRARCRICEEWIAPKVDKSVRIEIYKHGKILPCFFCVECMEKVNDLMMEG